jgi:hypothetical protein
VLKNDVVSYWIKESRDFGIAIKHRTLRIALDQREVSQEKLTEITRFLWERRGQDAD